MRSLEGDFHAALAQGRGQTVRVIDLAQGGVGVKTGEALIEKRQAVSSLCFRPLENLVTAGMDLVWKMFSKAAEKFLEAVWVQLVPQAD